MGVYNSSKTRVAPVFDQLFERDPSGRSWLPRLLQLGSRATAAAKVPEDIGVLLEGHPRWWGDNERRLQAPKQLLEWLVRNISPAEVAASGDTGEVRRKRERLAQRDPDTIADAIEGIQNAGRGRAWYLLEGESCPDACLQTDDVLIVIEGKRTERSCTSKTKWMGRRSQLIRHMDAAYEVRGGRKVFGLLIVEGNREPSDQVPSSYWLEQANEQVSPEILEASLPHRSAAERRVIADGVLGAATWQRLASEFHLSWPPVPDGV